MLNEYNVSGLLLLVMTAVSLVYTYGLFYATRALFEMIALIMRDVKDRRVKSVPTAITVPMILVVLTFVWFLVQAVVVTLRIVERLYAAI